MLDDLKEFFANYPEVILRWRGASPTALPPGMLERQKEYGRRLHHNLKDAQVFRIDQDAFEMMGDLINETKREGLDDLFSQVRLPFRTMVIVPPISDEAGGTRPNSGELLGVVTQIEGRIYTQRFVISNDGIAASMWILVSEGLSMKMHPAATQEFYATLGMPPPEGMFEEERASDLTFLSSAIAIATLLRHDGMLTTEQVSAYPRQQRRQAERNGKSLPDTLITRISLGKAGRGQLEAMREDASSAGRTSSPRRTHWVRGHYMRSRSGSLVWRMPHLRGAGPVVTQIRDITE